MKAPSVIEQGHDHHVLENPDAPFDKLVLQYGPPRSGTTLVFNSLRFLFKRVGKTHQYIDFEGTSKHPDICNDVVATCRDFRDICVSIWRVENNIDPKDLLEGKVRMSLNDVMDFASITHHRCLSLNKFIENKEKHNLLFIKYEDFYNDIPALLLAYEKHFGIEIPKDIKTQITESCSIEAHKKVANNYSSFKEHEKISQIHGYHILKNGEPGLWKQLVPPEGQDLLTQMLFPLLAEYGYEK